MHQDHELHEALRRIERDLKQIDHRLSHIEREIRPQPNNHFTLQVQEIPMAIGTIAPGTTGQFGVTLLDNGVPDTTGFAVSPTFTADDTSVTFAPATTDASNGSIPVAAQTVASVPAGDPGTSVTITASATAPDGTTATGTITVALTGTAQKFTLGVSQLA